MTPSRMAARAAPGVCLALAALAPIAPGALAAQGLAARAERAGTGPVELRLRFPARPGVCGAGDAILIRRPDGSTMFLSDHGRAGDGRRWREGEPPCSPGPVAVALQWEAGVVDHVTVRVGAPAVGGGERRAVDLGSVAGQDAADFLLAAAPAAEGRAGERLILAASLADAATIWPALLDLGRDRTLHRRARRSALHWLGWQAATEAGAGLGGVVRDRTEEDEVREAAVFALSRLSDDRAVPALIDVVRTVEDLRVRGSALFWLAESGDPRGLALIEEILAARPAG